VAAWAREVRRAHPAVAVVLAGDARTAWPVGTVEGPSLVVHSPRPVPPSRGLAFLYGAAREAAAIRAALPGAVELREEAANPAAVRANAGGKRLLHFAVHGQASLREGAASHLVLAGEDGLLQVIDVLDLPLAAARPVVVLSACSSGGRSADRENDGAGLAWAFLRAGARAVIAHQDALRDDVALAFSDAFYPALARGAGLSQAFEAALAHVRAEHGAEAAAGFLLSI
jgi:CHAT domain-containing protein